MLKKKEKRKQELRNLILLIEFPVALPPFYGRWPPIDAATVNPVKIIRGFPGGTVVKNLSANAGDTGSSPGLGRSHMPWSN